MTSRSQGPHAGARVATLSLLLAACASPALAQPGEWHLGVLAGVHRSMPPRATRIPVPDRLELGVSARRMVNARWGLRVELSGTRRSADLSVRYADYTSTTTIGQTFVSIPVLLHHQVGTEGKRQLALHVGPALGVPLGRCAYASTGISGWGGDTSRFVGRCVAQQSGSKVDLTVAGGVMAFVPTTHGRIGLGVRMAEGLTPWVPGRFRQTRHRGVSIVGVLERRRRAGG